MNHQLSVLLYGPHNLIEGVCKFWGENMEHNGLIKLKSPQSHSIVECYPRKSHLTDVSFGAIVDSLHMLREARLLVDEIDRAVSILVFPGEGGVTIGKKEIKEFYDLDLYVVVNLSGVSP